ncbi:nuclear envelope integral membrane protein-like [Chironomus tepperi]|uniref:nuclear envelope integral membrane protein-like n=1 Tax=Chironomus tepperi TaxID=113505 RepID=UPI00391F50D0
MSNIRHLKMLLLLVLSQFYLIHHVSSKTVNYLEPNSQVHVIPEEGRFGYALEKMNIFCYKGAEKQLSYLLKTVNLNIDIEDDDFTCYHGNTEEEVKEAHDNHKSIFSFNIFSHSKKRNIKLNPFNQTCIGISTSNEYTVNVKQIRLDLTKCCLLAAGLFLFLLSSKLSRNPAFFYLCGILLGVFASILVLIWFISKLIPKKPLMYGALVSGWALVAYFAQMVFDNIQPLLFVYQKYVAIYIITTSVISFGVCYYMGPPKHDRTKRLIMWALQLLGLTSIYFSSDFLEAVLAIIAVTVVMYYFPKPKFSAFRRVYNRFFPPKPRLLTSEEFDELGRRETEKALKELREYVKSPNCKQWKTVMNLSQPTRFASFVEGEDHITQDETVEHGKILNDLSSDEEDSDTSDSIIQESIVVDKSLNVINKSKLKEMPNFNKVRVLNNSNKITTSTPTSNGKVKRNLRNETRKSGRNATYELSEDED